MIPNIETSEIRPLKVEIVKDESKAEKRPNEIRTAHRTYVLTSTVPYVQVAGPDPARVTVRLNVIDTNPIVISGDISQASDATNLTAGLATPNGRILANTMGEVAIPGQDELWLTAAAYPTRVGVTIVREI